MHLYIIKLFTTAQNYVMIPNDFSITDQWIEMTTKGPGNSTSNVLSTATEKQAMSQRAVWPRSNQRLTGSVLQELKLAELENGWIKNWITCDFQHYMEKCYLKVRQTHLMQKLLQFLLQLHKVPGGDQGFLGLVQAVSGELQQLVLNESQHTIRQGQSRAWGTLCDDVQQPTLHLGCCLGTKRDGGCHLKIWRQHRINSHFKLAAGFSFHI